METIIVEIIIGVSGDLVDFVLPVHVPAAELLPDVIRLIEQTHPTLRMDKQTPVLCDQTDGRMLHPALTLAQSGVRMGHRLLLV